MKKKSHKKIFSAVGEKEVTRAIVTEFSRQFAEYVESDVIIVGAGPAGLMAGREIAGKGRKVLIIERNNYLGGGFWLGGYLMNKVTFREPAQKYLDELAVPYFEITPGLFVADGPHATSKLIASACDAGVKFANMTSFDDVVLRGQGIVAGVVVNWTAVGSLPRQITCVDPVALEAKLVADAMANWVLELKPGEPVCAHYQVPDESEGMGLTEAPRGAVGHWIKIKDKKIERYQLVVPTTWNASPRDEKGQPGPMEQALQNSTVKDVNNPFELVRVVRSFDPCLACAIHIVNYKGRKISEIRIG